jgi:hypothetical protein
VGGVKQIAPAGSPWRHYFEQEGTTQLKIDRCAACGDPQQYSGKSMHVSNHNDGDTS